MKKLLFIFGLFAIIILNNNVVKGQAFYIGTHVVSLGFGFGGAYPFKTTGGPYPAIGLSYEHGITEFSSGAAIGVGGFIGEKTLVYHHDFDVSQTYGNFPYYEESKWKYLFAGASGSYHVNTHTRYDPYVNVILGMKFLKYRFVYTDPNHVPPDGYPTAGVPADGVPIRDNHKYKPGFMYNFAVGTRYFWSNNVAAFIEAGYGISYVTFGLTVKIF